MSKSPSSKLAVSSVWAASSEVVILVSCSSGDFETVTGRKRKGWLMLLSQHLLSQWQWGCTVLKKYLIAIIWTDIAMRIAKYEEVIIFKIVYSFSSKRY